MFSLFYYYSDLENIPRFYKLLPRYAFTLEKIDYKAFTLKHIEIMADAYSEKTKHSAIISKICFSTTILLISYFLSACLITSSFIHFAKAWLYRIVDMSHNNPERIQIASPLLINGDAPPGV
ncbi:hypothetical protein A3Q56_04388 [Intoshia linei]|uniref:Uncharacterized protein n=1 Tax=Intoshia linei TaxID=1819745 RepID=A0A177B2D6_9BILA|nr:hypothetical protein A3Q56_04388 [Intoshia linei]